MRRSKSFSVFTESCPIRRTSYRTSSKSFPTSPLPYYLALTLCLDQERKYFDSGDYALSKAGKASEGGVTSIGSQHPLPENIPHLTSPGPNSGSNGNSNGASNVSIPGASSGSPVKESSFLQRETSVDEGSVLSPKSLDRGSASSPPSKEGVPIRPQQ